MMLLPKISQKRVNKKKNKSRVLVNVELRPKWCGKLTILWQSGYGLERVSCENRLFTSNGNVQSEPGGMLSPPGPPSGQIWDLSLRVTADGISGGTFFVPGLKKSPSTPNPVGNASAQKTVNAPPQAAARSLRELPGAAHPHRESCRGWRPGLLVQGVPRVP